MRQLSSARSALAPMAFALGLACVGSSAHGAVLIVDALADSSNSGLGIGLLDALTVTMGETFEVSASPDDLWSAGALPRWSNADGLTHDLFATGTDESGEPAGTLIGTNFGLLTINGFAAPFGSLVGEIGTGPGSYRLLGTHFVGPAWAAGPLTLFYWDSFTPDNSGSVAVTITAIPEPAAWSLMILGFGATGALLRRRRAAVA
jgi:hypothetical protein